MLHEHLLLQQELENSCETSATATGTCAVAGSATVAETSAVATGISGLLLEPLLLLQKLLVLLGVSSHEQNSPIDLGMPTMIIHAP